MKKIIMALLAVICCVSFVQSQTLEEVQQKYITALGGKSTLAKLKNTYQEATMEIMGMQFEAKMWIVYGAAMRQEVEIQGQKIITYVSTDKGWMINPMMGSTTPQPLPQEALKEYIGVLTPGGELSTLKERGFNATLEGKEDVGGKPAHKIKVAKDSAESTLYVDVATNYLVQTVIKSSAMGQEFEVKTILSDYKKTPEGYVFPYTSVVNNPMMGDIKMTITKLEVNKNIDLKELEKSESSGSASF